MSQKLTKKRTLLKLAGVFALSGVWVGCAIQPEPVTPDQQAAILRQDRTVLFGRQLPTDKPLSLHDAMARALKYNFDFRVKLLEETIAQKQLYAARFDLLPSINGSSNFTERSNQEASKSLTLSTGARSTAFSGSTDRNTHSDNLTFVWNMLDLGVSYFSAKQGADRVLVTEEKRRKVMHALFRDVRTAFWKAASAQRIKGAIEPIRQEAMQALEDARLIESEGLQKPLEILQYQRTLLEVLRQLNILQQEMDVARIDLSRLLNLPPGSDFELTLPKEVDLRAPDVLIALPEMERIALTRRPEIREAIYNARITANETKKAIARIFPGVEFSLSHDYDSTSFLKNAAWQSMGVKVTWNLLNFLKGGTTYRLAKNEAKLGEMRRQAAQMAILTQVHIAFRNYRDAQRQLNETREINRIEQGIFRNVAIGAQNESQNQLEYIRTATNAVMSRLQLYKSYANAQNAMSRIFVSLGVDPLPDVVRADDLKTLSEAIGDMDRGWTESVYKPLPEIPEVKVEKREAPLEEPGEDEAAEQSPEALEPKDEKGIQKERNTAPTGADGARPTDQADERSSKKPEAVVPTPSELQEPVTDVESQRPDSDHSLRQGMAPRSLIYDKALQDKTEAEVHERLHRWIEAKSERRFDPYFSFYADSFTPGDAASKEVWRENRIRYFESIAFTHITLDELHLTMESPEWVRVARSRRIGRRCCFACICAGLSPMATRRKLWTIRQGTRRAASRQLSGWKGSLHMGI
ncbi:MAG: TolC family protein [Magnetococcales bacterium]|nr:TolC family protein [Magnetococcales bacterium]